MICNPLLPGRTVPCYLSATMYTIMRAISRWYDVDIVYQDSISDKKYNLNISRDASIQEVLLLLQQQGLRTSIVDRKIVVGVKP